MRRFLALGGAVVAILLVAAVVASASSPRIRSPIQLKVVERATTDTEVDTDGSGGSADTTGDLLTFHNKVYNASNSRQVGRDLGVCTLIVPGKSYDCGFNTFLPDGQLSVKGLFSFTRDTTVPITGGSGKYANARGTMLLHARSDGNFDFAFDVLP